ncbi:tail fiber protein [uncultured Tateyamaria sp.]|uniref:phage tail protein n=1 Tax=Tateyamaria sp. 1078 TaxID=3417464 RepID=UPI0026240527|nr:tail fiber protein [uncultured Tateyamaria sp.]
MKKSIIAIAAAVTAYMAPAAPVYADDPFVGEIRAFGFNFCPRGWADAAGQLLAVSSNDALFSLYGTIYGGDGRTTFGLPDLRGRVPINDGTGPGLTTYRLGAKTGQETTQATQNTMPQHSHGVTGVLSARMAASTSASSSGDPTGNFIGVLSGTGAYTTDATNLVQMADGDITVDVSTTRLSNSGQNLQQNNMAPFLVHRYCVALFGIYPSRN